MIEVTIPDYNDIFDERTSTFSSVKGRTLQLEHSLLSIKKWEAKWHKPFLKKDSNRTHEELIDYIRCMTLTPHVDPKIYEYIPKEEFERIIAYIQDPMTATWFSNKNKNQVGGSRGEIVTAEVIYAWMVILRIPVEFEKWHLNQLMTLIRVVNSKMSSNENKMTKRDVLRQNAAINEARKARLKSKG